MKYNNAVKIQRLNNIEMEQNNPFKALLDSVKPTIKRDVSLFECYAEISNELTDTLKGYGLDRTARDVWMLRLYHNFLDVRESWSAFRLYLLATKYLLECGLKRGAKSPATYWDVKEFCQMSTVLESKKRELAEIERTMCNN